MCNHPGVTVTGSYVWSTQYLLGGRVKPSHRESLTGTGCHLPGQLLGHKKSVLLLTKPVLLPSSAH